MKIGRSKDGGWWIFWVPGWGKDNSYPKYIYYQLKLIIKFFTVFHHYELERENNAYGKGNGMITFSAVDQVFRYLKFNPFGSYTLIKERPF